MSKAESLEAKIENLRQWLEKHINDYIEIIESLTVWYSVDTTKLAKDLIEEVLGGEDVSGLKGREALIENLRLWLVKHVDDYVEINEYQTPWYSVDTTKLAKDLIEQTEIAGE
jgi:predicted RNase H-like HicB family nuclease